MIGSGLVQFTELNHFIGFSFFGDYSKYSDKIATVLITAVKYTPEHTVDYIKWTIEMWPPHTPLQGVTAEYDMRLPLVP